MKRVLPIAILLVIVSFIAIDIKLLLKPVYIRDTIVEVNDGETAKSISKKLYDSGIIRSRFLFEKYARYKGIDRKLSRGKYLFRGKITIPEALRLLHSARVILHKVTIPEGMTARRTAHLLADNGFGDYQRFMELINDSLFVKRTTGFCLPSLEGFLYPETYLFPEGVREEFILRHMVDQFWKMTANTFEDTSTLEDFYPTIILASIVEREARREEEKPFIADVYLNRIERGMLLQADPTVAYALENAGIRRSRILYKDLKYDSPYNTYLNPGLPPTPVCNPTISAIEATLNPQDTNYYFFFADGEGGHIFSETYRQHSSRLRKLRNDNGR